MGNCMSGHKLPENQFKVININDNKLLVQKGMMEVTATDLIYTDNKLADVWQWPLKYLRKYGCDGGVFSFEAGRKCPGGEGLYAFSTPRASQLFNLVARNINQGNLQPSGELSPFLSEVPLPDQSTMGFHRRGTSISQEPNYQNMDPNSGNPLVTPIESGASSSPHNPLVLPPKCDSHRDAALLSSQEQKQFQYHEVIFDKPPEEHPIPVEPKTTYTQIDFNQTEKYNRSRRNGTLPAGKPPGRTASSSSNNLHPSASGKSAGLRGRINTYGGTSSHRSPSDSSYSSQSSLTESSRDIGANAHSTPDPQSSMYQNLNIGPHGHPEIPPQPNYQNLTPGEITLSDSSLHRHQQQQQQPNYENLHLSKSQNHSTPRSSGNGSDRRHNHGGMSPIILNGGDSSMVYADLELSKHHMSSTPRTGGGLASTSSLTPVAEQNGQQSYSELNFVKDHSVSQSPVGTSNGHSSPETISHVPAPVSSPANLTTTTITSEQTVASLTTGGGAGNASAVVDATKVTYGTLDFPAMQALEGLSKEREQRNKELEQRNTEPEHREHRSHTHGNRDRSGTHEKKKRKREAKEN